MSEQAKPSEPPKRHRWERLAPRSRKDIDLQRCKGCGMRRRKFRDQNITGRMRWFREIWQKEHGWLIELWTPPCRGEE